MKKNLFWIIFVFLLLELFSIIKVCSVIGVFNAILLLIADVAVGIWLVKNSFRSLIGNIIVNPLYFSNSKNSLLVFSGLLFAFPGFITDVIALCLAVYGIFFKGSEKDININTSHINDPFSEKENSYTKGRTIEGTAVHEDKNER